MAQTEGPLCVSARKKKQKSKVNSPSGARPDGDLHSSCVGSRGSQQVWVLQIHRDVLRPKYIGAKRATFGLRLTIPAGCPCDRVGVIGSIGNGFGGRRGGRSR